MLAFREWTVKRWGARQYAKLENHGNVAIGWSNPLIAFFSFCKPFLCFPADVDACEQHFGKLMLVSVEDQRDTSSPLSADSPSPSPVFLPSPQHHSSSSSASSLSSSGSSDIVRAEAVPSL